jgi:hypothetical protein
MKPASVAYSQIGKRGQDVRQASSVSAIVGHDHPTLATIRRNLARVTGQEDAPAVEDPGASA